MVKPHYRSGFHEKLLEYSPVSHRTSVGWVQDGAAISKAELVTNSGNTSVITCLRRGEILAKLQLQLERGLRIDERNNITNKSITEEGGGVL